MYRKQKPLSAELEHLFDERDHLKVRMSLADNEKAVDSAEIEDLRQRLRDLEKRINELDRPRA